MSQDTLFNFDNNPLIVIASNRGPYKFSRDENGEFDVQRGAGGLVTALASLAERLDVLWIASAIDEDDRAWAEKQNGEIQNLSGINLRLLIPDEDKYNQYYNQIANPLLWFIQHAMWDMVRYPVIDRYTWQAWRNGYTAINKQFAETIVDSVKQVLKDSDENRPVIIMPQDYHLYLVPQFLREEMGYDVQIQPFVHIPWPGPDGWRILPVEMRDTLLKSLLMSDRIGFQTRRDAFNFVQTARFYIEDAHSRGARYSLEYDDRKVGATAYPISIDVDKVEVLSREPQTELHKNQILSLIGDRKLILRTDRVEPSKNILRGLQAYRGLLEDHEEHHGKVQMVMLLVPSRLEVDEYEAYLREIMAEAGMINAKYSSATWQPVSVILGNNYLRALAAMQIYDVLLINPIADGMNLVAKEGPLINTRDGVLVLSEQAGAFYELGEHAIDVSPFDVHSTVEALHNALTMPRDERAERAESLRKIVKKADVREWFANQLTDALEAFKSQPKKRSTPSTPLTKKSEASKTKAGVSSEATPTAKE